MKLRTIALAASAAILALSCAKVSDVTRIEGRVAADGIDQVSVSITDVLDTLVSVTDGKFSLEIPTDITRIGLISTSRYSVEFIPDGTSLKVTLADESTVKSSSPRISLQERYNEYNAYGNEFASAISNKRKALMADDSLSDQEIREEFYAFYSEQHDKYEQYSLQLLDENPSSVLSLFILPSLRYGLSDEQLNHYLESVPENLLAEDDIADIVKSVRARENTAPGKQFIDFEVETVVATTRSIPPQPIYGTVRFSDYVGKGKYVLVDFWSPWCGPCCEAMPYIKAVYEKYKGEKFDVLSIAVWEREPFEVTYNRMVELEMDWTTINNAKNIPTEIYGIDGIPHLMLIGPDGIILERGLSDTELDEVVSRYVSAD